MTSLGERASHAVLSLAVVGFLFMTLFGVFHLEMPTRVDGSMLPCPFMPGMNMCSMNALEHIAFVQGMLTSIPYQQDLTFALVSLLFLVATGVVWFRRLSHSPPDLQRPLAYFYYQRHVPIETSLQHLFSNGILNPKPF